MVQDQDWPLWTLDGFTVLPHPHAQIGADLGRVFGFVFGIFGGMAILSCSQLSGCRAFYQGSGQGSFIHLCRGPLGEPP